MLGQSNMSGRGLLADLSSYSFPNRDRVRNWLMNGTGWGVAQEPMDSDGGGAEYPVLADSAAVGPMLSFADARAGEIDGIVGPIPCAEGATSITQWQRNLTTSTLYGASLARIQKALAATPTGMLKAVIFYQGESDTASNAAADAWPGLFAQMVSDFRSDLSLSDLPFIMTVIGPNPNRTDFPAWDRLVSNMQTMTLPSNVIRVSANDLACRSDSNVHLTTASQVTLGQRYAAALP